MSQPVQFEVLINNKPRWCSESETIDWLQSNWHQIRLTAVREGKTQRPVTADEREYLLQAAGRISRR